MWPPKCISLLISTAVCFHLFLLVHAQIVDFEPYQMHIKKANLEEHLEETFDDERDDIHLEGKQRVRHAITSYFGQIQTRLPPEVSSRWELRGLNYEANDTISSFKGTNLVVTIKGERYGTPEDQVSLIGAHYDSTTLSRGVNDNGSGMAAILEIARVLATAMYRNYCPFLNTIIMVAFDHGERGRVGSQEFVKYFDEEILQKFGVQNFTGAFILDTMLNFDAGLAAQILPPGFQQTFPEQYRMIAENRFHGDFLATIARQDDVAVANLFSKQWYRIVGGDFETTNRIRQMNIVLDQSGNPEDWPQELDQVLVNDFLLRSDHKSFWSRNSQYAQDGLRAVYLTDTANYRGYMRQCYHNICDDRRGVTDDNLEFLQIAAEALMRSLTILATENTDIICSTAAATPGLSFMLLLASFLVWCH